MIIPKKFRLGGLDINVVPEIMQGKTGEARYCYQEIALDVSKMHTQHLEQAFLHELIHWVLYMMYEDDMKNNEKFVDVFAHFLHQALTTQEGEWQINNTRDSTGKEQTLEVDLNQI